MSLRNRNEQMKDVFLGLASIIFVLCLPVHCNGQESQNNFPSEVRFDFVPGSLQIVSDEGEGVQAIASLSDRGSVSNKRSCFLVKDGLGNMMIFLPNTPENPNCSLNKLQLLMNLMISKDELQNLILKQKREIRSIEPSAAIEESDEWLKFKYQREKVSGAKNETD